MYEKYNFICQTSVCKQFGEYVCGNVSVFLGSEFYFYLKRQQLTYVHRSLCSGSLISLNQRLRGTDPVTAAPVGKVPIPLSQTPDLFHRSAVTGDKWRNLSFVSFWGDTLGKRLVRKEKQEITVHHDPFLYPDHMQGPSWACRSHCVGKSWRGDGGARPTNSTDGTRAQRTVAPAVPSGRHRITH